MSPPQTQFNSTRLRQLLRASFLQGESALENFKTWNAQIDWRAHLNWDEYRLLPQVYRNLSAQQLEHPLLPKFKGIARKAWYNNSLYLHHLAPNLNDLRVANIPTLILYGGALALCYDNEYILPNSAECGVLVRESDAPRAFRQLEHAGRNAQVTVSDSVLPGFLDARYFCPFHNQQGETVLLQWQLLPHCKQNNIDAEFWTRAQETKMDDVPVLILNPTDQLLHTCIYGTSPRGANPLQRGIDVMLLLQFALPQINWQQFLAHVQAQRVTLPVRETFIALNQTLDLSIPADILEKIKTLPVSPDEQREKNLGDAATPRERIAQLWYIAARRTCVTNDVRRALQFPTFLQYWWGLEHLTQLPPRAWSAFRSLSRRIV